MGLDIGEEGKKTFREHILGCKTILWNGPVGVFEMDKFATGSKAVAEAIAEATSKGAFSLIGGGDSVACINKFGLADKVSVRLDGRRCTARIHRSARSCRVWRPSANKTGHEQSAVPSNRALRY